MKWKLFVMLNLSIAPVYLEIPANYIQSTFELIDVNDPIVISTLDKMGPNWKVVPSTNVCKVMYSFFANILILKCFGEVSIKSIM